VTRRRGFWPGQSAQSVPPGFPGDDDGGDAGVADERAPVGPPGPVVTWRALDHPLPGDTVAPTFGDFDHDDVAGLAEPEPTAVPPGAAPEARRGSPRCRLPDRTAALEGGRPGGTRHTGEAPVAFPADPDDTLPEPAPDAVAADEVDVPHGPTVGRRRGRRQDEAVDPFGPGAAVGRVRGPQRSVVRQMWAEESAVDPPPLGTRPEGRWRASLAHRLVAAWPGQSEEGAPPGFPASGEHVLTPPATSTLVHLSERRGLSAGPDEEPSTARAPRPRRLHKLVTAVHAALADPLVNAEPEVREQRAAQVRRFGMLAGSVALAVVLIYAIFPVRTYLEQRSATQRARERIDKLTEANEKLEEQKQNLRDDKTVEEIARRDYQLVFPGEESYGLLPPPVNPSTSDTTTTTTAPPPPG
jgi:cell division protein FtsB